MLQQILEKVTVFTVFEPSSHLNRAPLDVLRPIPLPPAIKNQWVRSGWISIVTKAAERLEVGEVCKSSASSSSTIWINQINGPNASSRAERKSVFAEDVAANDDSDPNIMFLPTLGRPLFQNHWNGQRSERYFSFNFFFD